MSEYQYQRVDNIPNGDHIRVLTLAPGSIWAEPIHVSLTVVKLGSDVDYEALSYNWARAWDTSSIFCEGKPFTVTAHLESALRRLRQRTSERVLWIDAICINQNDLTERSHQVSLMRRVYQDARRVLVWLGESTFSDPLVFPLCQRMADNWMSLYLDDSINLDAPEFLWQANRKQLWLQKLREQQVPYVAPTRQDEQNEELFPNKNEVNAAFSFLRLPWFKRCWVLQEVVLAKEAIMMSGTSSISWELFVVGISFVMYLGEGGLEGRRPEDYTSSIIPLAGMLRGDMHNSEITEMKHFDPLWMLNRARHMGATDPRDKVYAVLGLIDPERQTELYTPDYTISVGECYKRSAVAIMLEKKNLDVLMINRSPESQLAAASWVPDWDCSRQTVAASFFRDDDKYRPFCASTSAQYDVQNRVEGDVLILSGYEFDSIVALEDVLVVPNLVKSDFSDAISSMGAFKTFWKDKLGGLGGYMDTLLNWERFALSRYYSTYPTGEDPEVVYATTLCVGYVDSPDAALAGFRKWRKSLLGPKAISFLRQVNPGSQIWNPFTALSGGISLAAFNYNDRVFATATEKTLNRRLARTRKGFLALVPSQSVLGDQISLFEGGKGVPFVTRKTQGQGKHQFIGPCYVHGIMYGEAWDQSLIRNIAIV
ncbi:heterokaryon incompatibility protein-domain-containing protein [Xylariaceae sp. FL1272]|nr:heterokaryon incompatibility protein-domain-containing protein [Xylariaceae sp. FL1272]